MKHATSCKVENGSFLVNVGQPDAESSSLNVTRGDSATGKGTLEQDLVCLANNTHAHKVMPILTCSSAFNSSFQFRSQYNCTWTARRAHATPVPCMPISTKVKNSSTIRLRASLLQRVIQPPQEKACTVETVPVLLLFPQRKSEPLKRCQSKSRRLSQAKMYM